MRLNQKADRPLISMNWITHRCSGGGWQRRCWYSPRRNPTASVHSTASVTQATPRGRWPA